MSVGVKRRFCGNALWTPGPSQRMVSAFSKGTHLADGMVSSDGREDAGARGLTYPCGAPPVPGEAVRITDDVLWLRLPLPMALDHINVWAIRDVGGWLIVDTGIRYPASIEAWEAIFTGPLEGLPVTRVICTHMHPDHIGLAGWLCERFDVPLLMSRLEYVTARMLVADTGPAPEQGARFYHAMGWDEVAIARYRQVYGMFGKGVHPMPPGYRRLQAGQTLRIGDHDWTLVGGDGHSPEHICLWRSSDGVFISGDQILPRISSNVSVWPTEPESDPLQDWLISLARLRRDLPGDLLVLPSHGEPFRGVHARLDALIRGHEVSLKRLMRTLKTPSRAIDVFSALFARPVGEGLLGMATGESLAHLNYLTGQGRAVRTTDADGVYWWTAIDKETA